MAKLSPGQTVRKRREQLGLTRGELVDKIEGLSLSTLIRIELRDALPRVGTLVKIAAALDLSIDDLLGVAA